MLSTVGLLLLSTSVAPSAQAAGFAGPSYAGALSVPTGSRSESKLWWNDGIWWGCLWSTAARSFTIHRRITSPESWFDTGVAVDARPKSRADCLWDGAKLYIASHEYSGGTGIPGDPLELYRYSYDPHADRYSLDVGFPTVIADAKSKSLVIEEDATGTLWAVWMQGLRVWIAHTQGDDRFWSTPLLHPRSTSDLDSGDIAAVVSFQGGRIGVFWSDQVASAFRFSFHENGASDTAWSPVETVLAGPALADDEFALRAASDGRVFAALQTNTDEIRLEVRSPAGFWADLPVAGDADNWSSPILVLDEEQRIVHVFGTHPSALGAIHEKTAPMDALGFSAGSGTALIRDPRNGAIAEASSTKQSVRGSTGLVVIASHEGLQRYAFATDSLGGPRPAVPAAAFFADVRQPFPPASVQFFDASSGEPSQWSWAFGDGTTSRNRNPVHTYAQAGQYTVSLRVTNALGSDERTRVDLVRVMSPPTSLVVLAIADGDAYQGRPDENRGALGTLRIRGGRDDDYRSFMKFFIPPVPGQITSAGLLLGCINDSSGDDGSLYRVGDDWTEPWLTWNDQPDVVGGSLGSLNGVRSGETIAMNVSSVVRASGTVSFGLKNTSFHSATYSSRQGPVPPMLQLDLAQPFSALPEPRFEANRLAGAAPLTVQFFDTSSGRVEAWDWDFGDGTHSDLENPSHVFAGPGRYTVSLTARNANGADTFVAPALVEVRVPDANAGAPRGPGALATLFAALAPSAAERESSDAPGLVLHLEGSLGDVLELVEARLAEGGFTVEQRTMLPGGASAPRTFELLVRDGARVGRLRLQPETHERVRVTWQVP
jgi:PKD repeat protein